MKKGGKEGEGGGSYYICSNMHDKAISQYEHISQNISQLTQEPETITSFSI